MLITDPAQLEGWVLEEPDLITNLPTYPQWVGRCRQVYDQLCQDNPNLEYRPYQYEYPAMFCQRRVGIMAHAQGVGKTTELGVVIGAVYGSLVGRRPGTVQILVPTALSGTTRWLNDLNRFALLTGQVEFIRTERQALKSTAPIWVYTHDFIKGQSKELAGRSRPYISRLLVKRDRRPALLVVDEVHRFQRGSERSNHLAYLRRYAKRFIVLSGTISDGRLELIHHTALLTYGRHWPYPNLAEFVRRFGTKRVVESNYVGGDEVFTEVQTRYLQSLSVHRAPEYYDLSRVFVHRVTMADPNVQSCVTLPTLDGPTALLLEPGQEHRSYYYGVFEQHRQQLERLAEAGEDIRYRGKILALLGPLLRACSSPWEDTPITPVKAVRCAELVQQAAAQRVKTVVFTNGVGASRLLTQYLAEQLGSKQVVRLYATDPLSSPKRMSDDQREQALSLFSYDPNVVVGVFSLGITAESIDLTQASQVIYYDVPWQALKLLQSLSRLVRPGAVRPWVKAYYLIHQGMIDYHQYYLVQEKVKATNFLLDYDMGEVTVADAGNVNPIDVLRGLLNAS